MFACWSKADATEGWDDAEIGRTRSSAIGVLLDP